MEWTRAHQYVSWHPGDVPGLLPGVSASAGRAESRLGTVGCSRAAKSVRPDGPGWGA